MQNLMLFEGTNVEVFEFEGKVLFNPYDVGKCLDLTEESVRYHIRNFNDKQRVKLTKSIVGLTHNLDLPTAGRVYLTESGIYKLTFKSRKPQAERFSDWVTDEVLPTIRKHGAYMTPEKIEETLTNPDTIIQLAQILKTEQEKRRKLELEAEENKPKVVFANSIFKSEDTITVNELSKLIAQNGYPIGQNRLFAWLRDNGYLIQSGELKNCPKQIMIEKGYFILNEYPYVTVYGETKLNRQTRVTPKGQEYIINKVLEYFSEREKYNIGALL